MRQENFAKSIDNKTWQCYDNNAKKTCQMEGATIWIKKKF